MGNLRDSLVEKGLASAADEGKIYLKASQELLRMRARVGKEIPVNMLSLGDAKTVGEFKPIAMKLLLERQVNIETILVYAHGMDEVSGLKKLKWLLYELQNALKIVQSKYRDDVIRRHLRSSSPKAGVPPQWRER